MKTINVTFTDKEYKKIKIIKDKYEICWHKFIIVSANSLNKLRRKNE